jgi:transcription elongation factor GreA-like protein
MFDKALSQVILKQRGQNQKLVTELLNKISEENKERLYRIIQDLESDLAVATRKARMPWIR